VREDVSARGYGYGYLCMYSRLPSTTRKICSADASSKTILMYH
jgi:hypothetical protein